MFRKFRGALVVASSAAVLLATPAPSYAIFNWFSRACGCGAQPATYAPAVVEAAPVVAPTVVNYVPQTCYRTQYVTVPVTTYRPVSACDPCTGFPVTAMRPTIAYVQQARMVPYTTYRAVVTSGVATSYAPAYGAPAYGAPAYGAPAYGAPSAGCSGCSAAPAAAAPAALPYYNAAPLSTAPANGASTGVPTLAPGVTPGVSTFQRPIVSGEPTLAPSIPSPLQGAAPSIPSAPPGNIQSTGPSELRQKPIIVPGPETSGGAPAPKNGTPLKGLQAPSNGSEPKGGSATDPTSSAPRLINPDDRTTQRLSVPVRYAVQRITTTDPAGGAFSPVAWPRDTAARAIQATAIEDGPTLSSPSAPQPSPTADGWRASER